MPIDPSIALGVRPVEQPNMLGQMAQVMAMRQAQQEYENEGGLRNALTGGLPDDPSSLLQYGKQGRAVYESALKGRKEKLESDEKRNVMLGGLAGPVIENPTPAVFEFQLSRAVNYGLMTEKQKQEVLAQYGGSPELIKSYVTPIFKGSMTAQAQQADATSRANNAATVGASYYSTNTAAQTAANRLDFDRNRRNVIAGDNQYYTTGAFGDVQPVTGYGNAPQPAAGLAAPVGGGGGGAANAFVTARPSVNAFAPTVAPQGAGPTVAAAAALDQQANIPRPKQPFRAPVAVMQNNQSILVPADKAIGMQPATAFTEKQAFGKTETVRNLSTAIANLTDVIKPGGLLEKSTGSGLGRAMDASAAFFGQATEGAKAAAALAPIADLVLKMVPRFEGPQSDKDTQSYKEAAGQLADSGLPNETRREAAKVIIRLMTERREQFGMTDQVGGSNANAAPKTISRTGTFNGRKVIEYSDGTTAYAD